MPQSLLAQFSDVGPEEIAAVRRLAAEAGERLREQPVYVHSKVALLRIVRSSRPDMEWIRTMLDARNALGSDFKAHELREGGFTLHTLPGAERLLAATWQTNEWVGLNAQGDVVMYERWGAVDPPTLLSKLSVKQYSEWNAYRFEARAMVLDTLSRRARRVVGFAIVIDLEGTGVGHRKLIPYMEEFAGGKSGRVVPPMRSTTYCVRSGKVAAGIYALAGRLSFFSANLQATTFLIVGPDPFAASADFSTRFRRSTLPTPVGGTLNIGGASVTR